MTKLLNELGNVYGMLTVVERGSSTAQGRTRWLCQCDCGNTSLVHGSNLRSGFTKSCGCQSKLGRKKTIPDAEIAFGGYYTNTRWNAKRRKIFFDLTKEQVRSIIKRNCFYCGAPPTIRTNSYRNYLGNGLDRLDNDIRYVTDNIVPCCESCNRSKLQRSLTEFIAWAHRVAKQHPLHEAHQEHDE